MLDIEAHNAIEPWWYADIFHRAPPEGFVSGRRDGLTFFLGRFDISSQLGSAPAVKFLVRALLRPKMLFIGQSSCEYCFIPACTSDAAIRETILQMLSDTRSDAAVVLNLPCAAPFLPGHDNARSLALLRSLEEKGFQTLGGDDLWYIPIDFASAEDFLDRLPARHRQRIRRNLKSKRQVEIRELAGDAPLSQELLDQLFRLSENVVEASDTRFVRFTRAWFDDFFAKADDQARLFLFYVEEQLAGFTLCLCVGKMLIFKTTGLDYSISKKYHIYFVAWFHMLEYCVRHHLSYFVAGQSNDSIKSYLGARATPTIHSVYFRNSLLRWATRKLKDRLGFGLPSGAPITHPEG